MFARPNYQIKESRPEEPVPQRHHWGSEVAPWLWIKRRSVSYAWTIIASSSLSRSAGRSTRLLLPGKLRALHAKDALQLPDPATHLEPPSWRQAQVGAVVRSLEG